MVETIKQPIPNRSAIEANTIMDWTNIEKMDPDLLVGVVNTALRNHFRSLEDLCLTNDVSKDALCARLAEGAYEYIEAANQFR